MNFELLDLLTPEAANAALHQFLESEKLSILAMREDVHCDRRFLNCDLDSLAEDLKWFLRHVNVKNVPLPASEPAWVRDAHNAGIQEFEVDSKAVVLHAAYFLGECFVQANRNLKWGTGNPASIQKNMPVVKGFRQGHELAPLMIVENVFLRILGDRAPFEDIDKMVRTWRARLP